MVTLEAIEPCIIQGFAQYNAGERATFTEEQALSLLEEFPNGWREYHREDAAIKAPSVPPKDKMIKRAEQKK